GIGRTEAVVRKDRGEQAAARRSCGFDGRHGSQLRRTATGNTTGLLGSSRFSSSRHLGPAKIAHGAMTRASVDLGRFFPKISVSSSLAQVANRAIPPIDRYVSFEFRS